ncbi:MAG: recombinase family protein [Clostridiales bacterium]|nr:recombinase family protein [Clostridiales bacterium]
MYSDEGVSATSTRKRDGFNQMVQDALDGKIDLIITKTVSRFARNTVDSLTTIRQLKEKGVEVYFEEQNIYTLDFKGELFITIMSSFAQEESRSISENTSWGIHKRYADGKVSVAFSNFLGYERDPNGELVVDPEQAETVRLIYQWFLEGFSPYAIAKKLMVLEIPSPAGNAKWWPTTVWHILQNEKYKGDALLQKEYVADFLTKKREKNDKGVLPQYYVEGDHEAIIDPETFDFVQTEIQNRKKGKRRYSGENIFLSKVKCGCCGGWYGSKIYNSNNKYRRHVYRCNHMYDGEKKCTTPTLTEEDFKQCFVFALNNLIANRKKVMRELEQQAEKLEDVSCNEARRKVLEDKMKSLDVEIGDLLDGNTLDQKDYQSRYDALVLELERTRQEYNEQKKEIVKNRQNANTMKKFIEDFSKQGEPLKEFDEELWCSMVDFITVYAKDDIRVTFKGGLEVKA